VRTAKFVPRKQWVVCGADDMCVRVYNYNTMDKVKQFEAHTDYIRWALGRGGAGLRAGGGLG
jgi:coatomer subunit beta'